MKPNFFNHAGSHFVAGPALDPPEARAGSGGSSAGASGGDRSGTGQGGTGTGTGTGSGTPAAFRLTDDAMVDLGDGQPIAWREAIGDNGRYMSRDRFDRGAKLLETIAANLEKKEAELNTRSRTPDRQSDTTRQPADPFAEVRGLPIVDGATVAQLAEKLYRDGFGPLAQVVQQLGNKLTAAEKQILALSGTTGHLAGKETEAQFEQHITSSVDGAMKLGAIKGLPEGTAFKSDDPWVRELAKDIWLSHEQASWRKGEFEKALRERIEASVAFVKRLQDSAVETAREKRKNWFNPKKGAARPSGDAPYKHLSGTQMAAELFGQMENAGRT